MFHTSDETQEALSENKPGAHAMHQLHQLIHQAEHTAATPGGDIAMRNKYVLSLLEEIDALSLRAVREIRGLQKVPPAPADPMAKRMAKMQQTQAIAAVTAAVPATAKRVPAPKPRRSKKFDKPRVTL